MFFLPEVVWQENVVNKKCLTYSEKQYLVLMVYLENINKIVFRNNEIMK